MVSLVVARFRRLRVITVVLGGMSAACGCERSVPYLMERSEAAVGEQWFYLGGGCMGFSEQSGTSMGSAKMDGSAEYTVSFDAIGSGYDLKVVVGGELVEHRRLDEDFLESGRRETVTFDVPADGKKRVTFWGGSYCES